MNFKKSDKNFRMGKTEKAHLALMKGTKDQKDHWKKMLIDAQISEQECRQNPTKLRCSDGSAMWAV